MAARATGSTARRTRRATAPLSVGELGRDAMRLVRAHGARIWVTALPFGMATLWFEQTVLRCYPGTIKDQRVAALLSFYGALLIGYVAYAAIATAVIQPPHLQGHLHPVRSWRRSTSVVCIAAVAPLGTIAGLVAALVPGVVLWLSWVLAGPLAAMSGEGPFAAMRHSARMTWGSRRSLFYLFAAVQLATFAVSALIAVGMGQSLSAVLEDTNPLSAIEAIVGGLVESVQLAASGAVCCAAYQRLSGRQD